MQADILRYPGKTCGGVALYGQGFGAAALLYQGCYRPVPDEHGTMERMNNKLLALNVPTDFRAHVEFARRGIIADVNPGQELDHLQPKQEQPSLFFEDNRVESTINHRLGRLIARRYRRCFDHLDIKPDVPIADRLFEIEIRFIALLKTVDHSVPVAPLWRKYSRLSKTVERQNAEKVERDYVVQSLGYDDAKQVPHSMDDFRNASSLEEKAMIAELITADFAETMDEIAQHFHYKRNMFGRGATRTYSLIYAILALSKVFEAHNNRGRAAGVTLAAHGSGHEGDFLRFVLSFIEIVDTRNQNHRLTDGLNERVRKIAQKRNIDPGLISLLDQEDIDASVMLTFMERVDALKA